jgi:hypothetical protein
MSVTQCANILASFFEGDRLINTKAKKYEDSWVFSRVVLLFNATSALTFEKGRKNEYGT